MKKKPIPYEFVLEALDAQSPHTRSMFGCTSVYIGNKIIFVLRQRETLPEDNGIWIATTKEHHESLRRDFPTMKSISAFGPGVTSWQVLPETSVDFEEAGFRACEMVIRGDPRIGKFPKEKSLSLKPAKKKKSRR